VRLVESNVVPRILTVSENWITESSNFKTFLNNLLTTTEQLNVCSVSQGKNLRVDIL